MRRHPSVDAAEEPLKPRCTNNVAENPRRGRARHQAGGDRVMSIDDGAVNDGWYLARGAIWVDTKLLQCGRLN